MTSLWLKIILCPLIIGISSLLFPNVDFDTFWQPVLIGLVLAAAGYMLEKWLLGKNTKTISLFADFIASTLIVYVMSLFLDGAEVTFLGAILTAVLLTLPEIALHNYLVNSGRARKTHA
jgi:uncharacterized protein (DUF2062 family)